MKTKIMAVLILMMTTLLNVSAQDGVAISSGSNRSNSYSNAMREMYKVAPPKGYKLIRSFSTTKVNDKTYQTVIQYRNVPKEKR